MKILWLHSHFKNWMGGHKYIFEVAKRMQKDHTVTVAASIFSDTATKKFSEINVPTKNIGITSTYNPLYWLLLPFFVSLETERIRKLGKFDLVITSYFPAHIWAYRLKIPFVQICYEPLAFFYDQEFLSGYPLPVKLFFRLMRNCYTQIDKEALFSAKSVLTLSKHNAKWINNIYKRSAKTIFEGVDTEFFTFQVTKKLKEKYQKNAILFHSTDFTPTKGTDLFLKAVSNVIKKHQNVKALISYSIVNTKALKNIQDMVTKLNLKSNVEILGRLKYEELPKYYSLAKIVVQSSRNQSMSLSVKEAMACGTPVITCLEGNEQFTDGTAGFLVDPNNTDKLSDRISYILDHESAAKVMGIHGRKIALSKFSWDKVTEKIINYSI